MRWSSSSQGPSGPVSGMIARRREAVAPRGSERCLAVAGMAESSRAGPPAAMQRTFHRADEAARAQSIGAEAPPTKASRLKAPPTNQATGLKAPPTNQAKSIGAESPSYKSSEEHRGS